MDYVYDSSLKLFLVIFDTRLAKTYNIAALQQAYLIYH